MGKWMTMKIKIRIGVGFAQEESTEISDFQRKQTIAWSKISIDLNRKTLDLLLTKDCSGFQFEFAAGDCNVAKELDSVFGRRIVIIV
ncbi:unnamed protein product [Lactuca virosa]|uniref:Uncharacterized protein n=1 Tax=Lactuca virosa TaxID=75947 RepID=A0AAU9PHV4_9ASTR|nr:unnamed protein product [Lactuca virosa]